MSLSSTAQDPQSHTRLEAEKQRLLFEQKMAQACLVKKVVKYTVLALSAGVITYLALPYINPAKAFLRNIFTPKDPLEGLDPKVLSTMQESWAKQKEYRLQCGNGKYAAHPATCKKIRAQLDTFLISDKFYGAREQYNSFIKYHNHPQAAQIAAGELCSDPLFPGDFVDCLLLV